MRAIVDLHDYVFMFLIGVLVFVTFILFIIVRNNFILTRGGFLNFFFSKFEPKSFNFSNPFFYLVTLYSVYYNLVHKFLIDLSVFYYDFCVGTRSLYYHTIISSFNSTDVFYRIIGFILSIHSSLRNEAELTAVFGSSKSSGDSSFSFFSLFARAYQSVIQFPWVFFNRYGSSFTQFFLFYNFILTRTSAFNIDLIFDKFYSQQLRSSTIDAYLFSHNDVLETVWTLLPSLILIAIAIPSLLVLFALDEVGKPVMTVKAVGHQWYWSYEVTATYPELGTKTDSFDSYMVATSELSKGDHRNLEVDNLLRLPFNSHIRLIVTSMDVIHSWAVPALGVKVDAVPGRLNQVGLFIDRPGVFYGQCSEICGANHGFMPICVKADLTFSRWMDAFFEITE